MKNYNAKNIGSNKRRLRVAWLASAMMLTFQSSCDVTTQSQIGQIVNQIGILNPSSAEVSLGLKEALEIGTALGSDRLSSKDGFLGNAAVKILFPQEAKAVEQTLRSVGLGSLADNVVTTLNRAAESAVIEAKPIFIAAIKQMTFADATNILFGSNDAATNYFKRVTTAQLMEKFNPIIHTHLGKVGATKYWSDAASAYNRIATKPIQTDLANYVTQKAIEGLFLEIAKEEGKIRTSLNARTSPTLQKVFGYADRQNSNKIVNT